MTQALCINTHDAPANVAAAIADQGRSLPKIDPGQLNHTLAYMVDRSVCDTKSVEAADVATAESTLQLLPYLVLRAPSGKLYHYSRGKGGAEDRLKKNTSIGVGGHVDSVPPEGVGLYVWLQVEAAREVLEEVGVAVPAATINFTHYIVDRTNPVGRVHLGLFAIVDVPDEAVASAEPDMLTDDGFFHLSELSEPNVHQKLENWSQMLVNFMVGYDVQVDAQSGTVTTAELAAPDNSYSLPA